MQLQKCSIQDAGKFALFNKQLIEDEKSDNPMDLNELEGDWLFGNSVVSVRLVLQ